MNYLGLIFHYNGDRDRFTVHYPIPVLYVIVYIQHKYKTQQNYSGIIKIDMLISGFNQILSRYSAWAKEDLELCLSVKINMMMCIMRLKGKSMA